MSEKRLYRSTKNRIIGGVCGGLGEYFEIDPVLIRLIVALLFITGLSIIFYILAWIIIPEAPDSATSNGSKETTKEVSATTKPSKRLSDTNDEGRIIIGSIVILIGLFYLFQNIVGLKVWGALWPLILVFIGLFFILKSKK